MGPRQSLDLMREWIEQLFPGLQGTSFEITSPRDRRYNCVAWAANDTRRWWWPGEAPVSSSDPEVQGGAELPRHFLPNSSRLTSAHGLPEVGSA